MSRSNRLHRVAIGGILVALSLGLSSEGSTQGNPSAQPTQPQQQQPTPAPPPVVKQQVTDPGYYTTDCQRPKDHDGADLCQQIRQAQAGEDAVWWARFQTYLGIFGIVGVLGTILYSHLTLRHSSLTTRRQLRAYVSVAIGQSFNQGGKARLRFEFRPTITNNGQTPAYRLQVASDIRILPNPLPDDADLSLTTHGPGSVITLGAQQNIYTPVIMKGRLSLAELREVYKGDKRRLYVFGRVTYEDTFGDSHTTHYCFWIGLFVRRRPVWNSTAVHNAAD